MAAVIGCLTLLNSRYTLSNIKSKTVGDGQHGTARWATDAEIRKTYALVPFQVANWRNGLRRPEVQGLVLGSISHKRGITALADKDDVYCLMIGASGVGKTAYFLYPNLEYACASGMSFLALDTKGDLARNYGAIAEKYYGYHVSVVDLRNPTRSDGYNLMTLINHYMNAAQATGSLAARAKAEKYAKILAKTIVSPNGDTDYGQNAYFYDAAEGLLTSVVLLLAEFLPPERKQERRHIVSVFKLVQELLAPSGVRGKNWFTILMEKLPPEHKARWFAGAALNTSDQAMASVMSTVLSRLNAFLDSELEQVLCFDSTMNAERFAAEKSAIFLILPEEDQTKNFMAGLMIQTLARELFAVADENNGRLPGRVVFFCDELGTMPAFDILPLFSAGRSRGLTMVPIIQALAQLEKNYGREGAEILTDNCQDTIFGGFAPNSQTAEQLSKALGSRTVLSGSVSRSKNDPSQSLQMMERPLMTPDELKSIPKGSFVVMKTGTHPMQTKLRLFLDWGITFGEPYITPEHAARPVAYASRQELFLHIDRAYGKKNSQRGEAPIRPWDFTMRTQRHELRWKHLCGSGTIPSGQDGLYVSQGPLQRRQCLLAQRPQDCRRLEAVPPHRAAGLGGLGASWIPGAHPSPASQWQPDQQFLSAQIGRKKRTSHQGRSALSYCYKGSVIVVHPEGLTLSEVLRQRKNKQWLLR